MTRYREGSRAIFENSAISSRKRGRLSASIIQPVHTHQQEGRTISWLHKIKLSSHLGSPWPGTEICFGRFSHWAYISPWSCRRRWCRSGAGAAAPLSPGLQLFHRLESRHTVWSRMSSAPKLSHLQTEGRVSDTSVWWAAAQPRFPPPTTEKKGERQNVSLLRSKLFCWQIGSFSCEKWEFAGRFSSSLEELEKGKRRKGSCQGQLMLSPYWAEGTIKTSRKEDLEAGLLRRAVQCLVWCVCVCVCVDMCAYSLWNCLCGWR